MGFKSKRNTIKLILNLIDGKQSNKAVVEMPPQKTQIVGENKGDLLPRATSSQIGILKTHYENFLNEAALDKTIAPHCIMVVRDGLVVAERSYGVYKPDKWNTTYSMSKTLCGMAIGFLVDEGKLSLDDKICKIFAKRNIIPSLGMLNVTLRQVLNMTSGSTFNETGSVTSDAWISDYLSSNLMFEPGSQFNYNSMNSFMLGAAVKEITGQGLFEFLTPRLFEPLGIKNVYWELNPDGIEKGGWGLYILPEDMAKLGLLVLNKGSYNGKQVLSREWMTMASTTQAKVPEVVGKYNYGFQMWTGDNPKMAIFNGMFGQNIFVLPDSNTVVVATASESDMFQSNNIFPLVEKYFGIIPDEVAKPIKYVEKARVFDKKAEKPLWDELDGKTFFFEHAFTNSVGVLPLVLQILQNNYTTGLDSLSVYRKNSRYKVLFTEGEVKIELTADTSKTVYEVLELKGEKYEIAVDATWATNEDDEEVLKLKIYFLEFASVRTIKIFPQGDKVAVKFSEEPGRKFLMKLTVLAPDSLKQNRLFLSLADKVDVNYLSYKIKQILEQEFEGSTEKTVTKIL